MCFKDFNYKNVYKSDIKNICKFKNARQESKKKHKKQYHKKLT